MLNTGYERVRIPRNANPGAGIYDISLCHPDESVCPEFAELTVANARIEFEGAGPLSPTNPATMWRFKFEGAANRGICDKLEVFELSKPNNLSLDFAYALHRTKFNAVSDIWCYLNTVESHFAGTVPIDPTGAGNYVAYMTDDLLGQASRNARHVALAFTASSSGDLTNLIRYFEDGPIGSVEGYYRGETPQEFGWAGKPELGRTLKTLIVRHGDILDGIELVYDSGAAAQYGNRRQGRGDRVDLAAGEEIVEISGYLGQWFGARHILQITLRTSQNRSFGPMARWQTAAIAPRSASQRRRAPASSTSSAPPYRSTTTWIAASIA